MNTTEMKTSRPILLLSSALLLTAIFASCAGTEELRAPSERTLEYLRSLPEDTLRTLDTDEDGLNDYEELFEYETDPLSNADMDSDGLSDAEEILEYDTDYRNADTDGDGLSDGDEVNAYDTDPNNSDSDGDGLNDGDEINTHRTDPNNSDSDNDGISDFDEINTYNSDPNNSDSDGDGFTDSQEVEMGTDLNDGSDPVYLQEDALNNINFDFDKSNIRDDAAQQLSENVEMLQSAGAFRVRVDAYTDHVGGDQYNLRLSLRRAKAVVDFYTENGIPADRIDSRGLGKAPVPCPTEDPNGQGCERNRRAESHPISPYKYKPNN